MAEKRIRVWVQEFRDRTNLMLQWIDPNTNRIKSRSARTDNPKKAEDLRADLESDLNNGRYQEATRMTWETFRERFEDEYVAGLRPCTRKNYGDTFELFERLCNPTQLRSVNERTLSAFAAAMRKEPGRGHGDAGMMASSIKVRLQFLRTALRWAVEQGLLVKCPKFPKVKVPDKNPQPVLAGWLAGLRLAEAFELRWEETEEAPWVDLARDRIVFPAGFVKGVRDQWVPLDPELRSALLALPRRGRKVFHFPGRAGRPASLHAMSGRVISLARAAGVKLSMKSLRRGFGCRYAGKVPAQVLQKLMRHGDIKTTMKYYANVDDAVMEAVLGPKPNSSPNRRGVRGPGRTGEIDATPESESR
jgi:integrase